MQWYFKHSQTHESAQRILREPPTNKQAVTYFLAVTALHQNLNEDRVEEMEVAAGIEGAEVLVEALKSRHNNGGLQHKGFPSTPLTTSPPTP